jgi:hypothetical protein
MTHNHQSHQDNPKSNHSEASLKNCFTVGALMAASAIAYFEMREFLDPPLPNNEAQAAPKGDDQIPTPSLPAQFTVYRRPDELLGKYIPHINMEVTWDDQTGAPRRQVDIASAHPNSVICIVPGMTEGRLEQRDGKWRAGWEQMNGTRSCQEDLELLAQNFGAIRDRGLTVVLVSAQKIPTTRNEDLEGFFDILWDQQGSLGQALGLEPFRYQNEEFLPRATMLVKDGKIVAAFSAASDFEELLRELLSDEPVLQPGSNEALMPSGDMQSLQPAQPSSSNEEPIPSVDSEISQPSPSDAVPAAPRRGPFQRFKRRRR